MDMFEDKKKKVLNKLDINSLIDQFDNERAESSMVPAQKTTPDHQGNPVAIWCWCNVVFRPLFGWLLKDPHLPHELLFST